jgi:membrane peptidoglycan carboxypeptidase
MKREIKRVAWVSPRASWLHIAWVEASESWHQIRSLPRWVHALFGVAMLLLTLHWESTTGVLESHLLSHWARGMTFYIQPGPANGVVFPRGGPADVRRGYTRIPEFTRALESEGFRVTEQARFSPALAMAARVGISPPYREPVATGLAIEGADGSDLCEATDRANGFSSYEDIPPIVARSLLFIENRELDKSTSPWSNPAIDWGRWAKAVVVYSARKIGLPVRVEGGSTLAVQVEKYRHSEDGRTGSPVDKLRQVLTASLRAYQEGRDTREERRHILVDYLNSVPLGATPGHGEVFGLNQGLSVWFGLDPARVMRQAQAGKTPGARARAMKHVLALLCAVRAPSRYLRDDHAALERRADAYAGLLAKEGIFDSELAGRVQAVPLAFVKQAGAAQGNPQIPPASKATSRIRIDLEKALAVRGLYDLTRLHLNVESTVDAGLQRDTEKLMAELSDPAFLAAHGLLGEHLLAKGNPARLTYSVRLCERSPDRNEVRVHADNLRGPFDVNEGTKMALGSTAKVRTLVHYLEVVERLHQEISGLDEEAIGAYERGARDPLTRWACESLRENPLMSPESLLTRAVERTYSASPHELFFTGGGLHAFVNFDDADNGRRLSVRDAAAHSTNLVFVRLMRDLVRYHEARLPYNVDRVLSGQDSLRRRAMLTEIIDSESRATVSRAYQEYKGLPLEGSLDRLLGAARRHAPRSLAILYFAWHPHASPESLGVWLGRDAGRDTSLSAERLAKMDSGPQMGLLDYASLLLGRGAARVWTRRRPGPKPRHHARRADRAERGRAAGGVGVALPNAQPAGSGPEAQGALLEQDAFARMAPSWRRLGFPFAQLVPSYATAIGSSADRPAALAELMGTIMNNGEDLPAPENQPPRVRARNAVSHGAGGRRPPGAGSLAGGPTRRGACWSRSSRADRERPTGCRARSATRRDIPFRWVGRREPGTTGSRRSGAADRSSPRGW